MCEMGEESQLIPIIQGLEEPNCNMLACGIWIGYISMQHLLMRLNSMWLVVMQIIIIII